MAEKEKPKERSPQELAEWSKIFEDLTKAFEGITPQLVVHSDKFRAVHDAINGLKHKFR